MSVQSFKVHVFLCFFIIFLCFSTTSILYPLQALWQSPGGGKENVLSTFYLYFYLITCTLNIFLSSDWYPKCTNSGWKDKWLAPMFFFDRWARTHQNPTSPLGDRWFRACVSVFIPSTPTILYTVLEEGFSPPPTSSPGLKTVVPNALVATYIRFFRHPGHHHFFIIFPTPFYIDSCSILAPNLRPKSLQNPLKLDLKSDL